MLSKVMRPFAPFAAVSIVALAAGAARAALVGAPSSVLPSTPTLTVPTAASVIAQCRSGELDLPSFLTKIEEVPQLRDDLFGDSTSAGAKLGDYFACRAAAQGGVESCKEAGVKEGQETFCRDVSLRARFVYAALTGSPGAQSDCEQFIAQANGLNKKAKAGAADICRAWVEGLRQNASPQSACGQSVAAGFPADGCPGALLFSEGRPESCGSMTGKAKSLEDCRLLSAMVGALRSGKGTCAGQPLCDALMKGDPAACAPFLKESVGAFCADATAYDHSVRRRQDEVKRARMEVLPPVKPPKEAPRTGKQIAAETEKRKRADALKAGEKLRQAALDKAREDDSKEKQEALEKQRTERQYTRNAPMQVIPPDVQKEMKEIEEKGLKESSERPASGGRNPRPVAAPGQQPTEGDEKQ